ESERARRGRRLAEPRPRPAKMQFLGRRHEAAQVMKIHPPSRGDYINFLYKREPVASPVPGPQALAPEAGSTEISMREYSIAAIPADGIGPEVIAAGVTALESLQ